ncbi:ATP-binding protein [Fulvivirga ulvae]|uniref:ATP-binding protein n=1 Tax=Fulvivirga ulvae TaxID=2904245 RepID=UPI001F3DB1DC|nr:ATP-binding protein [Fulvivirga ulvae]UII31363.1 ATP-binding protein [Fulvivirga ulvae]
MIVMKNNNTLQQNAQALTDELKWLSEVINLRIALHFGHDTPYLSIEDLPVPDLSAGGGTYVEFVHQHDLNVAERLVLILGLAPHLKPGVLDILSSKNQDYDRRFSEFGGLFMEGHSGLVPTAETAMFILAGDDLQKRLDYQYIFRPGHVLTANHVITGASRRKGTPRLSREWLVADEYIDFLITGEAFHPTYGEDFPAQLIDTQLEWEDVVLSKKTSESIREIKEWAELGHILMSDLGLGRRLKPGYKSLFYGPPGTGKTMTAALLGKSTGKPVYKIDLSMVVSKYIGETEKNLAKVFDQAEKSDWILFFDEADSLFGKRTQVNSANDRFGNQEIGYLLQRIEDFSGVVILATNLKENIDEAFTRRFQSMIEFRTPGVEERLALLEKSFSDQLPLEPSIDKRSVAEKYELTGGVLMNVVRKSTLRAIARNESAISKKDLEEAIQRELQKEGIILS